MSLHILYWPNIGLARAELTSALSALPGVRLTVVESCADVLHHLAQADVLVCANPAESEAVAIADGLSASARCRWVHLISAGQDALDQRLGPAIRLTNTPGATADAVATHALALALALMRRIPQSLALQRDRNWSRGAASRGVATLHGKTVTVLGHGAVGQQLCHYLSVFGCAIRVVSRSRHTVQPGQTVFVLSELGAALHGADLLFIALPLSDATHGLVSRDMLLRLNPGALVVNVGRGAIVDQAALIACLHDGALGGAGLDVTQPEPPQAGDPIWDAPHTVITPHYGGGGSALAAQRVVEQAVSLVQAYRVAQP